MTVTLNLTDDEAEALYQYTHSMLEADIENDEMNKLLESSTSKLREQL